MPFAAAEGGVAVVLEGLAEGGVMAHVVRDMKKISPRVNHSTRWNADSAGGVGAHGAAIAETKTGAGERIEIRRGDDGVAPGGDRIVSLIVGDDKEDVRLFARG